MERPPFLNCRSLQFAPFAHVVEMNVAGPLVKEWDGAAVRTWLERRVVAARTDQVAAERGGRERQDDCDKASAEEMVCAFLKGRKSVDLQATFQEDLKTLLDRDDYVWRGVYHDGRFDRHVRTFIKKLVRMTKANAGFENLAHYQ